MVCSYLPISILIFCLLILLIIERNVNSLILNVKLSIFSALSVFILMYFEYLFIIYIYILRIFKSLLENWTVFHFAMFFFISVNIPCFEIYFIWYLNKLYFFGLVLASYTFIHPFTFNQCLSVYLKWVSDR